MTNKKISSFKYPLFVGFLCLGLFVVLANFHVFAQSAVDFDASGNPLPQISSPVTTDNPTSMVSPEWMQQQGYSLCSDVVVPPPKPNDCTGAGGVNGDEGVKLLPDGNCFIGLNCH